jgi:ABC-2 type transport system ATP-binding protein
MKGALPAARRTTPRTAVPPAAPRGPRWHPPRWYRVLKAPRRLSRPVEPAIAVRGVTKQFERRPERGLKGLLQRGPKQHTTALAGVDLEVRRGELFGLLGPNGAGKTTLVKVLCTLLLPDQGTVHVDGLDVQRQAEEVRRRVGVVLGGERALYWRLTARENLWYFAQLYDMPSAPAKQRIQHLLELVGLQDRADERVETYSKGMKQRLHIARGLLHDPAILLLDEPTIGLDPHAARTLRTLVRDLVEQHGRTVVLTTHYMGEADALSDRVAVLHRGKVVALDAPETLKARHGEGGAYRVAVRAPSPMLPAALGRVPGVRQVLPQGEDAGGVAAYRVLAAPDEDLAMPLAEAVRDAKASLVGIARDEPTLEDVFVALTGEAMDERGEVGRT